MAKILVVEDNAANMELATDLLRVNGHQVVKATDGRQAIEIAKSSLPDLILMDIQLPGISGLAATRILRNTLTTRDIPIIALTAFAMKDDRITAAKAGCNGFIAKPICTRIFPKLVDRFISNGANN